MKKIFLGLIFSICLVANAFAANVNCKSIALKDSSGNAMTDLAIANAATVYSQTIYVQDNVGYSALLAIEDKSGGAGSVTISAEYSLNGSDWYTVYTTSSGTLTADSNIVTTLANQTRWIQYTARLAKYLRYKIVANAASEVTLTHIYQEDR